MKCAYCGKNNKPGAIICKRCGIAMPVAPPQAKKDGGEPKAAEANDFSGADSAAAKRRIRRAAAFSAIIALAALFTLLAAFLISRAGGAIMPAAKSYSVRGGEAPYAFYCGEDACPAGFELLSAETCLNGKTLALLAKNGALFSGYKGETNAVENTTLDHALSADGSTIVYRDVYGLLWSYKVKETKSAPVCLCTDPVASGFAVSPDGGSVVFNKLTDLKLCLYTGKSVRELGDGLTPISVSNGGRHIYAYSVDENALYHLNKKGRETYIRSNLIGEIYLDSDHEEIAFSFESGPSIIITMASVRGGEPVEILNSEGAVFPVVPAGAIRMSSTVSGRKVNTCPFSSFEGKVFAGAALVRFSTKGAEVLEPNYCSDAVVSSDLRTVLYMNAGGLSRRKVKGEAPAERIVEKCSEFLASSDCARIWYLASDGSLHFVNGVRDALISPAVISDLVVSDNGRLCAFTVSGSLFSNRNGNPKASYRYEDPTVLGLSSDRSGIYVLTESGWEPLPKGGKRTDLTK